MIYAIGDSHADFSFRRIAGVRNLPLGPVTMKRMGNPADTLLLTTAQKLAPALTANDVVIFSCGEGDVRCFINPVLVHRTITMEDYLGEMAGNYVNVVASLPLNGARGGILSIPPPAPFHRGGPPPFAPTGTDGERALYARTLNGYLATGCQARGLIFVDVHSLYADAHGMMPDKPISDGCVHVGDTSRVRQLLMSMGLLR